MPFVVEVPPLIPSTPLRPASDLWPRHIFVCELYSSQGAQDHQQLIRLTKMTRVARRVARWHLIAKLT